MFSFGLLARRRSVMLEDERSFYYICSILFHVQNFRNFKLLESERLAYEIPLWTSFLCTIVILMPSAFRMTPYGSSGYPKTELHRGTSCLSAWYTISLKFLKKIFGFCFSVLYIIIRCSISFLCKVFDFYALRHVLKISDLREKFHFLMKKEWKVFGRYVLKQ